MKNILLSLIVLLSTATYGQKVETNTRRDNFLWITYTLKKSVNEKWSWSAQIQTRRYFWPDRQYQWHLPRVQVNRKLSDAVSLGLGFSYFLQTLPLNRGDLEINRPEIRPHQSVTLNFPQPKWDFTNRLMIEERWIRNVENGELVSGNTFLFRFRYQFGVLVPLQENKKWVLNIFDEIFLNAGKKVSTNIFDHNRLHIGIKRKIHDSVVLDVGYMYWYQQFPSLNNFGSFHIINIGLTQSL